MTSVENARWFTYESFPVVFFFFFLFSFSLIEVEMAEIICARTALRVGKMFATYLSIDSAGKSGRIVSIKMSLLLMYNV